MKEKKLSLEEAKKLLQEEEIKKAEEFRKEYVALCQKYGMEIGITPVNFIIKKIQ